MQDDTVLELAIEYKPALHPARNLNKLFILNKETGVYTTNSDYIDEFYAGTFPNKGNLVDGQGVPSLLSLTAGDIEIAAPADIVLEFKGDVFFNPRTAISVGGAAGELKAIINIVYAGTLVTITMDSVFVVSDVATVTGRFFGNHNNFIDLVDQAIVNNIV